MDHRPVKRASGRARHAVNRFGGVDGGGNRNGQAACVEARGARQMASPGNRMASGFPRDTGRRIDKETARAVCRNAQAVQRFGGLHLQPPSQAWRAAMRHKSAAQMR